MKKRVCALYRVSTIGQVEKDDIPMQKQRCHEFAEQMGWTIVSEFSEKGVSGFKISAKDRDAIQAIQREALAGTFDILLVFMFDRLGRREDETPFIVEWFVKNGIEVWSTVEGQQRFDTHVDKLMNYIRYWQASGESLKTSVRTKTRLAQIVQEGRFRGGTAPYGYQLVKKGRLGKKNKELYDIEINPTEAPTIKRIFDLADRYGYGSRRISTELKHEGLINTRTGEPFHYSSIQNILKNIMYVGILRSGETHSEVFSELQIITSEQFERVRISREQRSLDYEKKCEMPHDSDASLFDNPDPPRRFPRKIIGNTLLSGNIYCGHCGGRLFASTARKSHHATAAGTYQCVAIYKCYNRTQHKELCNGPTSYRAERIDSVISNLLEGILSKAEKVNEYDLIQAQLKYSATECQQNLKKAKLDLNKNMRELSKWENLMLDSLEGRCVFTPEQVKKRLDTLQSTVDELIAQVDQLTETSRHTESMIDEFKQQHQQLVTWASIYESASIDEKKVIAAHLIKAVTLERGYQMSVEFNISEAQYLTGMDMP